MQNSSKIQRILEVLENIDIDYFERFLYLGALVLNEKTSMEYLKKEGEIDTDSEAMLLSRFGELFERIISDDSPEYLHSYDELLSLVGKDQEVYLENRDKPLNAMIENVSFAASGLGTFIYSQENRVNFKTLKEASPNTESELNEALNELIQKKWVISYLDGEETKYYFNNKKLN